MAMDVVTFGEAMMLLVADKPGPLERAEAFVKRTAGAETNVAIGLARLGLQVAWCSRLGTDSMGRFLLQSMRAKAIDCSHVVCDATQRTGFMIKGRVEGGGDPEVEYHRKGSAASLFQPEEIDTPWLVSARHLHVTGIFAALSSNGVSLVVVKLGAAGAYFASQDAAAYVPGNPVDKVVDTVGAGDGFAVGVISGMLEGLAIPDAVRRGAWIGARAVQVLGDTEGLPTRAELADL